MPPFKDYPADYSQSQLFPSNVFDLLPDDHDCFVYRDLFEQLDTSEVVYACMPTTLPSPVDREAFRFVAVDAAGAIWEWIDHELVWVRVVEDSGTDSEAGGGCVPVH